LNLASFAYLILLKLKFKFVHATGIDKKIPAIIFFMVGLEIKFVYICNNLTGPPDIGQFKFASKPKVLFYSASNLLPVCGVQSVQRTERNSTTNSRLKSSAE